MVNWEKASHRKTNDKVPATIQEIDIRAELKPWQWEWRGGAECENLLGNKPHRSQLDMGSKRDGGIKNDSKVSSLE